MTYEYMQGLGALTRLGANMPKIGGTSTTANTTAVEVKLPTSDPGPGTMASQFQASQTNGDSGGAKLFSPVLGGLQITIPAGNIPISAEDREWFKRWFKRVNPTRYATHAEKDPTFVYMDPDVMAKFIDAKDQVAKGLANVWDVSIGAGGAPKTGILLTAAQTYFNDMMLFWTKCDRFGGHAWATAASGLTTMKLPRPYVEKYPEGGSVIARLSCPTAADAQRIWYVPTAANRTSGTKLLQDYIQSKGETIAASTQDKEEELAAKQQEVDAARQQANDASARADALAQNVNALEQRLAEMASMIEAASTGGVDNATMAALQSQVSDLMSQLSAANQALDEQRREADLAQQAADMEQLSLEGSFMSRYKWHLAIGGIAAVGVGLWYYYTKYLPSKEGTVPASAAPKANPEDEEPVYDRYGEMVGTVSPSRVPGRWIARPSRAGGPVYSSTSARRAAAWLKSQ